MASCLILMAVHLIFVGAKVLLTMDPAMALDRLWVFVGPACIGFGLLLFAVIVHMLED